MRLREAWGRWLFQPVSVASAAAFRIAYGAVALSWLLGLFPSRALLFGREAIVSAETTAAYFGRPEWLHFRFLPQEEPGLAIAFLVLIAAAAGVCLGVATRACALALWVGLMALRGRDFFVMNAGDDLMRIEALILCFMRSGDAYALGPWLGRRLRGEPPPPVPRAEPWGLRLLQLQVAYLYLNTFWLKLQGPSWHDGTAMYYALNYVELQRFDIPGLFDGLGRIKLLTWGTLAAEAAMGTLVWIPRLRHWVLLAAAGLHLGINATMSFATFQWVMLASLLAFVDPGKIEALAERLRSARGGKRDHAAVGAVQEGLERARV
jgi:hypothetical protein